MAEDVKDNLAWVRGVTSVVVGSILTTMIVAAAIAFVDVHDAKLGVDSLDKRVTKIEGIIFPPRDFGGSK